VPKIEIISGFALLISEILGLRLFALRA